MSGGWNTIESDAGVFTFLIESLGVQGVQFEELLTLDPESLQELQPLGVIFLFKYPTSADSSSTTQHQPSSPNKPLDGEYDFAALEDSEAGPSVWFAAQTIQNACGTQAVLSLLLNKTGTPASSSMDIVDEAAAAEEEEEESINIGPHLRDFRAFTSALPSDFRGEALSNSDVIRTAHNAFARSSPFISDETAAPSGADDDDDAVYHFIAYVSINSTLYELDGLQRAPIRHGDRGACPAAIFSDAVIPVLQRRISRYPATEIRFNLLALIRDPRPRLSATNDLEMLAREEAKRRDWRWENALRRWNFVGLIGELAKGVSREKLEQGEEKYEQWIEGAKERTRRRGEERRGRKGIKSPGG